MMVAARLPSKRSLDMSSVTTKVLRRSDSRAPAADSAAATSGITMLRIPRRRAMPTEYRPAPPPPPIISAEVGSMPWRSVIPRWP